MELIELGIFMLIAFWMGYKSGKGETMDLPKKLRFAVRDESKESAIISKLEKDKSSGRR